MPDMPPHPPLRFVAPHMVDAAGLVAITPDVSAQMLRAAYAQGIFPWADNPVRWYCPDPRAIFERANIRLPSNLQKLVRRAQLHVTFDAAFEDVMRGCARAHAADGVWITPRFIAAYVALHAQGFAHSVEVWQNEQLVGGVYGVQIGQLFAGESMFHTVPNASKAGFAALVQQLDAQNVKLFDAQVLNAHTERLGASEITRDDYLARLHNVIMQPAQGSGARWPQHLGMQPSA